MCKNTVATTATAGANAQAEMVVCRDGTKKVPVPRDPVNASRGSTESPQKGGMLASLPPGQQFVILAILMFLFFGVHNVLQEAIMKFEGFTYGVMLGYMEVVGVTTCSFLERKYVVKETGRKAPLSAYPLLTMCLLASSALSNMSLNYINFPTKVVIRSCKLVPTMAIATIINRKVFTPMEYICAVAVCAGVTMFAAADWKLTPSFNFVGIALVTASVCADAILPNAQERLFRTGSSRLEVTLFTNLFTLIVMTVTTAVSGDLVGVIRAAMGNSHLALYMAVYTVISYIAISTYMRIVKKFGGVAAVLLATARKGMTLVLSFMLFPKAFSWFYVVGAFLVLGGLLVASLIKQGMCKTLDNTNAGAPLRLALPEKDTVADTGDDLERGNNNNTGESKKVSGGDGRCRQPRTRVTAVSDWPAIPKAHRSHNKDTPTTSEAI